MTPPSSLPPSTSLKRVGMVITTRSGKVLAQDVSPPDESFSEWTLPTFPIEPNRLPLPLVAIREVSHHTGFLLTDPIYIGHTSIDHEGEPNPTAWFVARPITMVDSPDVVASFIAPHELEYQQDTLLAAIALDRISDPPTNEA